MYFGNTEREKKNPFDWAMKERDQNEDSLTGILLLGLEKLGNLVTDFAIRHTDIILGIAILAHQREEAIVGNIKLTLYISIEYQTNRAPSSS